MPRNLFTSVLLFLGLGAGPAPARDLQVEVEVLHIGGLLAPAELEALLADERLSIVATYEPTRLIEGVTARRERTLPRGPPATPGCLTASEEVQALTAELQRIREAFLRP